jgi:hypothetical protein
MGEHETYFAGGCPKPPETCPDVIGACTMDCPTGEGKDCLVMSGRKCKSIMGSFEPGGECPETECLNCYNCDDVFGAWRFTEAGKDVTLTLDINCTSKLVVTEASDGDGGGRPTAPIPISEMKGKWGCLGRIVGIIWREGSGTLEMVGEGENLRLCERAGDELRCARRVTPKLNSRLKGIGQGRQQQ